MKPLTLFPCAILCALAPLRSQTTPADPSIPHLEKRGMATQLIVDGQPFLALSGELNNTISSNLEYMKTVWPMLAKRVHLNLVLTGMAWNWIEPEEGKYDFSIADAAIENARQNNVRIAWLWFASWKNGLSSFAPPWVKADQERFPRAQITDGKTVEVLSTLAENNWQADARAFAALMRHVREVDKTHRVVMVQLENEVGLIGDSRDRSPLGNAAFGRPVPKELMDYLQKNKDNLLPEFRKIWEATGFKTSGTWEEVFGKGPGKADEIFMGWNYSRYINHVAEAGKKEYPIPMYVNAWLQQPNLPWPGKYPSGGPVPQVHDVWRAGAPSIDVFGPDNYVSQFGEVSQRFMRNGNPLLIAEANGGERGAAQALYAAGQGAIGFSVYGIEYNLLWQDPDNQLGRAYKSISQLMPLIAGHQGKEGEMTGVLLEGNEPEKVRLGDYTMTVQFAADRRIDGAPPRPAVRRAGALFVLTAPDEFYVTISSQTELAVTFTPNTPGPPLVGVGTIDEGSFVDGRWVQGRRLDHRAIASEICVYCQPALLVPAAYYFQAAHSEHTILRVKLYRYQ